MGDRANVGLRPTGDAGGALPDVTERDRAEAALRESEERFRTLADNIAQLAWMADPTGRIFWYNRRWVEYTGTTPEEMHGWGWTKVHHPEHVDRVVARIQRAWDTGEPWEDTFPLRGKDGQYRWFLSRALPIRDEHGAIVRWFGTNTDITERKEAEEALSRALAEVERQRDAAERAHASLQSFLGMIAHDLRNPLASMLGNVQLLRRARQPVAPERQARALEVIEGQGRRMNELIGYLVDAARIGVGQLEVRPEPTDLVALATRATEAAQAVTERHRVVLEAPERLEGEWDPGRLAQVLDNLLANAVKYSPDGGDVRVRVGRQDGQAIVSIADHGLGMRPEDLPRLFQQFSRLDPGRKIEGTGLGLYITRGIVEAHGGQVRAESSGPGTGSTFTVALPLKG